MFALLLLSTAAFADEPKPEEKPRLLDLSGAYSIWGLDQHGFLLGNPDQPLDDADYVVQNLRVKASIDKEHYGVVARMDAAQGWWGVDNSPDVETTTSTDADGNPTSTTVYNPYKIYRDKDFAYTIHFDLAYAWVVIPGIPVKVQAGRMYYGAGHGLVLDQDLNGVMVNVLPGKKVGVDLMWALMSEGFGSVKAPTGLLMTDEGDYSDANLFGGKIKVDLAGVKGEAFGFYYLDTSGAEQSARYLPDGLGYPDVRFHPQVATAMAFGLSADGKIDVADGLSWELEGDFLTGTDDVENTDSGAGAHDVNNGSLMGWNGYAKATQAFTAGIPIEVGVLGGIGSGDDDPTSGHGNFNRLQTMGFFAYTNVWEDSVMPDAEGISPQGLGSPISRGYREFENTIAVQGRLGIRPVKPLKVEASYTFLRATAPVHGFDATGVLSGQTAQDLGQEIDGNLSIDIWKGVNYSALFGWFIPGDAAGLLINGNTSSLEPAWELKQTATFTF